jgi:hypothetical protein
MRAAPIFVFLVATLTATVAVHAQTGPQAPYTARELTPAHGDLARSAGVPAKLANEEFVEALARVVYYWGYPAIDVMTRTSQWQLMKQGRAPAGSLPWRADE